MSKHTPGPWSWSYSDATFARPIAVTSDVGNFPDVLTVSEDEDGPRAYIKTGDAYLIAAAPDLLEACQRALDVFGDKVLPDRPTEQEAREFEAVLCLTAAIAKAKGEPA